MSLEERLSTVVGRLPKEINTFGVIHLSVSIEHGMDPRYAAELKIDSENQTRIFRSGMALDAETALMRLDEAVTGGSLRR